MSPESDDESVPGSGPRPLSQRPAMVRKLSPEAVPTHPPERGMVAAVGGKGCFTVLVINIAALVLLVLAVALAVALA